MPKMSLQNFKNWIYMFALIEKTQSFEDFKRDFLLKHPQFLPQPPVIHPHHLHDDESREAELRDILAVEYDKHLRISIPEDYRGFFPAFHTTLQHIRQLPQVYYNVFRPYTDNVQINPLSVGIDVPPTSLDLNFSLAEIAIYNYAMHNLILLSKDISPSLACAFLQEQYIVNGLQDVGMLTKATQNESSHSILPPPLRNTMEMVIMKTSYGRNYLNFLSTIYISESAVG